MIYNEKGYLILCGILHNFVCFPKVLPLVCCFIVSQCIAIGLGYAGLSACQNHALVHLESLEKSIKIV